MLSFSSLVDGQTVYGSDRSDSIMEDREVPDLVSCSSDEETCLETDAKGWSTSLEQRVHERCPSLEDANRRDQTWTATTGCTTAAVQAEEGYVEAEKNDSDFKQMKVEPEMSFLECVQEASSAYLTSQAQKAATYYAKALSLDNDESKRCKEDKTLLKYAFACASLETGTYESLMQSIAMFEEIASATFPLAYYGLGRCFTKLNRFKKALEVLTQGRDILNGNASSSSSFQWPGSSIVVEESDHARLKVLVKELITFCQKPPRPDAICCYESCELSLRKDIYYTDPDFKGFIRVKCKARCCLYYHNACWKCQKDDVLKNNDKDLLGSACLTPDCKGPVIEIVYVNSKRIVSKQFVHTAKIDESGKPKSKKTKIDKKPAKKKKKKPGDATSQGGDDKAKEVDEDTEDSSALRKPIWGLGSASSAVGTHEHQQPRPLLPVHKVDPVKVSLEHVLVLKKSNDEQLHDRSWQKVDHKDKKRDKRKGGMRTLSIHEFLGDRNETDLFDYDYLQRLSNLEASEACMAMNIDDEHILEIQRSLVECIEINGPVSINGSVLLNTLGMLPDVCQEAIVVAGGIETFVMKNRCFALVDDYVYLTNEESIPAWCPTVPAFVPFASQASSMRETRSVEKKLDVLDVFDASSDDEETATAEVWRSTFQDDEDDEQNEAIPSAPGACGKIHTKKPNSLHERAEDASMTSQPCGSAMSDSATSPRRPDPAKLAWSVTDNRENPGHEPPGSVGRLKHYDVIKRFLRFIPSFSETAQKTVLRHLLNVVVCEKVLQRYKTTHSLNMDVEGLEKSFRSIAHALGSQADKQTQTEPSCESDETCDIGRRLDHAFMQAQLSESLQTTRQKLKESQQQFQVLQESRKMERTAPQVARSDSTKRPNDDIQSRPSVEERIPPAEQEDLETNWRVADSKNVLAKPPAATSRSRSGNVASLAEERDWNDDQPKDDNGPRTSLRATPPPPSRATCADKASKPSLMPLPNSFERVMGQLRAKFPTYSRDELREFVQQLRANRNHSLTGLTIDAIVLEVSKLVSSEERQQLLRRRSTHNITFKNMSSLHNLNGKVGATATMSGLEKITDGDMPWSKVGNERLTWDFERHDDSEACVICHEEMTTNVYVLSCHHRFHNQCIHDWFRHQSTCPICRVLSLPPDEFPHLN